ncbi:O-methyltransferase [Bacillus pinisoli]|uniref:O-methyltransferase n=1 Tax=Bacillus pinisoli TaxID=2901866 RepID=UPI001FF21E58|nr:O-methyltransferase [Bacillus pinisoli]
MIPSEIESYLHSLIPERESVLLEMEQYAKEHQVPIMELVGIEALLQFIRLIEPKSILEIGTAIGYSSIRMAKAVQDVKVVTIERDDERYQKALYYIKQANMEEQIQVILGDALEVNLEQSFDVIFIDAAKGQYTRFFEKYEKLLAKNGVIISDNVLFKGLVAENNTENKRIKSLVKKIQGYNEWLMNHPDYHTTILPIGDGIAISKKKR